MPKLVLGTGTTPVEELLRFLKYSWTAFHAVGTNDRCLQFSRGYFQAVVTDRLLLLQAFDVVWQMRNALLATMASACLVSRCEGKIFQHSTPQKVEASRLLYVPDTIL